MSKPLRQKVILDLLERGPVASQEELQRALSRRGLRVGQATLSRDIRDLGLVKTATGYAQPQGETASESALPPVSRLVREFAEEDCVLPRGGCELSRQSVGGGLQNGGEGLAQGEADAACGTGHDCDLVGELVHATKLSSGYRHSCPDATS